MNRKNWAASHPSINGPSGSPQSGQSARANSYQAKLDAYDKAMAKYERDKKAYALAYAQWARAATACRAGDRSQCAPPNMRVAQK